jgi:hypothetical protein
MSIAFQAAGRVGKTEEKRTVAANNVVPTNFFPDDIPLGNIALIDSSYHPAALRRTDKKVGRKGLETTTAVSNREFSCGEH